MPFDIRITHITYDQVKHCAIEVLTPEGEWIPYGQHKNKLLRNKIEKIFTKETAVEEYQPGQHVIYAWGHGSD